MPVKPFEDMHHFIARRLNDKGILKTTDNSEWILEFCIVSNSSKLRLNSGKLRLIKIHFRQVKKQKLEKVKAAQILKTSTKAHSMSASKALQCTEFFFCFFFFAVICIIIHLTCSRESCSRKVHQRNEIIFRFVDAIVKLHRWENLTTLMSSENPQIFCSAFNSAFASGSEHFNLSWKLALWCFQLSWRE